MTITTEAITALDITAATALSIARDLRNMTTPSISLAQIIARLEDAFEDATMPHNAMMIRSYALMISRHPAIRNAIRA